MGGCSRTWVFAAAALAACTPAALANTGTPFMWATCFHLFIGNALIGWGEGVLISRCFGVERRRAVTRMIIANYASMLAGCLLLILVGSQLDRFGRSSAIELGLVHIVLLNLLGLAVVFGLTWLVELPFVCTLFTNHVHPLRSAARANLAAQSASYAVLALFYSLTCDLSAARHVAPAVEMARSRNSNAWVYFISDDGDAVEHARIDGSGRSRVATLSSTHPNARIFWLPGSRQGSWELWVTAPTAEEAAVGREARHAQQVLSDDVHGRAAVTWDDESGEHRLLAQMFGYTADLTQEDPAPWSVRASTPPAGGLSAIARGGRQSMWLGVDTPFVNLRSLCPTLLPHDQVVYQLGDQIVLLDLNTMQIGVIARGRSPVVLIEEGATTSQRVVHEPD